MSFGISGSDPFKSYSSNADAGGGMGVYTQRVKRDDKKKEKKQEEDSLLDITDDNDEDENIDIDLSDDDFLN